MLEREYRNPFAKRVAELLAIERNRKWWEEDDIAPRRRSRNDRGMMSDETRAKISRALTGRKHTDEEKRKIRDSVHRAYATEQVKAKFQNRVPWNKGIQMREESKKKLSAFFKGRSNAALVGRKYSAKHKAKLSVTHIGKVHSEETKLKMSLAHKGRDTVPPERRRRGPAHHFWGKSPPKIKRNNYAKGSYCQKGHWVRSTWERGIADWLYAMGVEYQYEPRVFDLGDGIRYRPDFYIPQADLFLEVKGYMWEADEEKLRRFVALGHKLFVIGKSEWGMFERAGSLQIPGVIA